MWEISSILNNIAKVPFTFILSTRKYSILKFSKNIWCFQLNNAIALNDYAMENIKSIFVPIYTNQGANNHLYWNIIYQQLICALVRCTCLTIYSCMCFSLSVCQYVSQSIRLYACVFNVRCPNLGFCLGLCLVLLYLGN